MASEYKLSFTAEDIDERLRKAGDAVLTTPQELTEAQKEQVKANIDVKDGKDGLTPEFRTATITTDGRTGTQVRISVGDEVVDDFVVYDGETPVKGTDYWTEADKAEILAEVEEDWQLLCDTTTTEEIVNFGIDKDMNGNPFSCRKIAAEIVLPQAMTGKAQMFFGNATELWGGTPYMGINSTFTSDVKPTYFDLRMELMKNKLAALSFNNRASEYFAVGSGADQVLRHRDMENVSALTKFFFCNAYTAYPFPAGTRILVWGCKA